MLSSNLNQKLLKTLWNSIVLNKQFLRNGQYQSNILNNYANIYRPEIESELEYLAVQTKRWTIDMLAESFNYSIENVRLILRQRTKRRMQVRSRSPSSLFNIKDEEEREKIIREHIIKRDLNISKNSEFENDDDDPVDYQVLAEESNLVPRQRPTDVYMERYNDGFFSNIISSSSDDDNQQNERDESIKKKKFLTSSSTLLDRITKLRLNTNSTNDTYSYDQNSELYNKRMKIIKKMQQTNDSIVEINERKQKFLEKLSFKK
ncbi:unnamed protein product [Rotaria sp. Silwood1]|nr:unnamed protein product [Rotaria sp. Silwood1]